MLASKSLLVKSLQTPCNVVVPFLQAPRSFSSASHISKLAFAPDARSLFVLNADSRLEKYDVATGKMLAGVVDVHRGASQALAVSPDGALVATGGSDRMVKVRK